MPAVPALITAGGAIGSSIISGRAANSAAKKAAQRSPEELAYMKSQTDLANDMRAQGGELFRTGMPQIRSTVDYYRTLLDGSRAARMNAVSGETQDVAEAYQGAEGKINQKLRGGEREQALAENSREKAGQIARLVTGVRPGAAAALSDMGTRLVGGAQGFEGTSANIGNALLTNATGNRQNAYEAGQKAGGNMAEQIGKITSLLASAPWGKGGGARPLNTGDISNTIATGGMGRMAGTSSLPDLAR